MIGYIKGEVMSVKENTVLLLCGSMGYEVQVTEEAALRCRQGEESEFYTHFLPREDGWHLFGFTTAEEKKLFLMLLGVSGVGPKAALGAVSFLGVPLLLDAFRSESPETISRVPGIGPKTAKKIIIDLKDKVKKEFAGDEPAGKSSAGGSAGGKDSLALEALESLGYSRKEAMKALKETDGEQLSEQEQIRKALKILSGSR